jgi:hypothetical protein
VIAMFMGKKHAIKLLRAHPALLKSKYQLAGAQSAIDQNLAMSGRDERAISCTAAPEHHQTEHAGCLIEHFGIHKWKCGKWIVKLIS